LKFKRPKCLLIIVSSMAFLFDLLFWRKSFGVSFVIYVCILLVAAFGYSYYERKFPAHSSLLLSVPIGLFSVMTIIRLEPVTRSVNFLITLTLLMVLAYSYRLGNWWLYRLGDYFVLPFKLFYYALTGAPQVYHDSIGRKEGSDTIIRRLVRYLLFVLRGLLLSLPVLIILAVFLASADPIFSDRMIRFFSLFNLSKIIDFIFRVNIILIIAYILLGIFGYAIIKSKQDNRLEQDQFRIRPFLGTVEAGIILGCVNILFFLFVLIQFQYFFGGDVNIGIDGFTYAQYARRGFAELVMVAIISASLFLVLSSITHRERRIQRWIFSSLGIVLGVLVGIILTSSFQRLLLYEDAFGFTRLRTYPHVFMVWLGLALSAFIVLELSGKTHKFGLVLLIVGIGFSLSLGVLNVDGFIVEKNIDRALKGRDLDLDYLLTLSSDATPTMVNFYFSLNPASLLREQVGSMLACQAQELHQEFQVQAWTEFNISTWRARNLLDRMADELNEYQLVGSTDDGFTVIVNGVKHPCKGKWVLE